MSLALSRRDSVNSCCIKLSCQLSSFPYNPLPSDTGSSSLLTLTVRSCPSVSGLKACTVVEVVACSPSGSSLSVWDMPLFSGRRSSTKAEPNRTGWTRTAGVCDDRSLFQMQRGGSTPQLARGGPNAWCLCSTERKLFAANQVTRGDRPRMPATQLDGLRSGPE